MFDEVDNFVVHTMQMESNSWSELWKLALPELLSWSAVILRLPELFISLRTRPHHIACSVQLLLMVAVAMAVALAVDGDAVVVGAGGGC